MQNFWLSIERIFNKKEDSSIIEKIGQIMCIFG